MFGDANGQFKNYTKNYKKFIRIFIKNYKKTYSANSLEMLMKSEMVLTYISRVLTDNLGMLIYGLIVLK